MGLAIEKRITPDTLDIIWVMNSLRSAVLLTRFPVVLAKPFYRFGGPLFDFVDDVFSSLFKPVRFPFHCSNTGMEMKKESIEYE